MDISEIKQILEMMKENDLAEFELEDKDFRLALKRPGEAVQPVMVAAPAPVYQPAPAAAAPAAAAPAAPAPAKAEDDNLKAIPSPIVGTFYRASSPDAEPFVSVGQEVDENTVVCIVEAMKVMNEIKAECRGIIRKVMVENASPVQFGQALFKVETL